MIASTPIIGATTAADSARLVDLLERIERQVAPDDRPMTLREVMAATGLKRSAAHRLITDLEAVGLPRKGQGRSTHWLASQFWHFYREWDTRP